MSGSDFYNACRDGKIEEVKRIFAEKGDLDSIINYVCFFEIF